MSVTSDARPLIDETPHQVPHICIVDAGLLPGYYSLCYSSLVEDWQGESVHPVLQDETSQPYCDFISLMKERIEAINGIEGCEILGPVLYVRYRIAEQYEGDEIMRLMVTSVIEYMMFQRIEEIFSLPKDSLRTNRRQAEPFSSSDEF